MTHIHRVLAVRGCDDETVVDLVLTEDQLAFLTELCTLVTSKSKCRCQPRMYLEEKEASII